MPPLAFTSGTQYMANAVWTGSLPLGLVVVPVRLYPAVRKKVVRFHELDRGGRRVRHVRVSEPEVEFEWPVRGPEPESRKQFEPPTPIHETPSPEVAFEEIRKGYEV